MASRITEATIATETPDLARTRLYRPAYATVERLLSRLRWLQHGHLHLYVLYIGVTIVALLVWHLGLRAG